MYARTLHGNREVSYLTEPPQTVSVRIGKVRSRSR
jgi:hypothetical protein